MSPARTEIVDWPVLRGEHTAGSLTDRIAGVPGTDFGGRWVGGVCLSAAVAGVGVLAAAWLLYRGVGVWGVNVPVGWGMAISNFVWWIGIGHAGTLISAILLLMRQSWRNSINRFAEAMTIFAVINAALFPLLHLGRYWKFYYLLPYPNEMTVWPQWRSPLIWDAFAVGTYFIVSVLFWYLGLIPDLATMRDGARARWSRRLLAAAALGWRGEARQWASLRRGYLILAGLATALVVSVHSIVSLDFAVGLVPGWNPTIFPPYFVAGAIYSGMAMVLTLAVPLRSAFGLRDLVTGRHLDLMAKVMLCTGLIVAYGYASEMLGEWLSDDPAERYRLHERLVGNGAVLFWSTVACNVVVAQALWVRRVRAAPVALWVISLVVNLGMWLERYDIVVTGLERGFVPSAWRPYTPTFFDWALLAGTLGLFAALFLLFVRVLPVSPMHELKELAHRKGLLAPDRGGPDENDEPVPPGAGAAAAFDSPEGAAGAAAAARRAGHTVRVYSPMPLEGLPDEVGAPPPWIARLMLAGGVVGGSAGYSLLYWSAVHAYPWAVGGKPLHSWPSFIPVTFELAVLGASLAGFVGVLAACRLPRLHHPVFDIPGFERASRDRFIVIADGPGGHSAPAAAEVLRACGPVALTPYEGGNP